MAQLNKLYQAEPEIREGLQGRIEVFGQNSSNPSVFNKSTFRGWHKSYFHFFLNKT
jgi:hypothetical protein